MTTPDTADVRTWARENGIAVSDRGRLPAEVHEAYRTAGKGNAASPTSAAKKRPAPASKKATPARKPPARKAGAATPRAVPKTAPAAQPRAAASRPTPAQPVPAQPAKPVDAKPVDRVDALHEQIAALTSRVVKLEQAKPAPKRSLFSRKG